MKWPALLVVLAVVPALRIATPQRSAVRGAIPGSGSGPRYVPVDFDNDGLVDLFAIEPSGAGRLLAHQPDGSFQDRTEAVGLASVGAVASAYWKDLTNDRWPDVIVVGPDGRLGLFLGDGQTFSDQTAAVAGMVSGPVQVVAFEDYDLNGWFDLGLWGFDGSVQIVQNYGDLIFAPGEIGSTNGGLRLTPVVPVGPLPLVAGGASGGGGSSLGSVCADQIIDQATSQCINASSTPALGRLYPLSSNLFVQNTTGNVGIHTTTPTQRLDVSGVVRATGGFQFPDGSIQTTATVAGPAGAPGLQGPEGQPGTTLPAGTVLMTATSTAPSGFLLCDGAEYLVGDHPDLAVAIGTTYGGTPGVTFRVPDMRQRFPLGKSSSGTGAALGSNGGQIDHTHSLNSHTHGLSGMNSHAHSIGAHFHGKGSLAIGASGEHFHQIPARRNGTTGLVFCMLRADNANNYEVGRTDYDPVVGDLPGPTHTHPNSAFSGIVGNGSGGNGDLGFDSGAPDWNGAGGGLGSPGATDASTGETGFQNPPFLTLNYIIKR